MTLAGCAQGEHGPSQISVANSGDLISQGKPVTSTTAYYDHDEGLFQAGESFPPSNVVDGNGGDTELPGGGWSYWLAADHVVDSAVTIDLGDNYKISKISLQDTHNREYRDRGAKDFVITAAASAGGPFWEIGGGAFTQDEWANLTIKDIPINVGAPNNVARYVRVHVLSCWGCRSVGLNEVMVFGVPATGAKTGG